MGSIGSYLRQVFNGSVGGSQEKRAAAQLADGSWADAVVLIDIDGKPGTGEAPVSGFTAITVPGRGWGCNVTTGGWVLVTAVDDTTVDKFLNGPGNYEYPDRVKNVIPHPTKPAAVLDGVYGRK
ncbi:hypothetical protein [Methylorubrum suomiense]|uniref:Uncharacterized protein n=1 Tax=Methylorubrum suomiense TaxID=144191 RepID=A0ABQ4V0I1_9HYPH|nr:hypothetical protein [Methylorubrum suomiense]GJE78106.1 hypothetical protein BGCPKDLD_4717 [Methylorubrum suomiense]